MLIRIFVATINDDQNRIPRIPPEIHELQQITIAPLKLVFWIILGGIPGIPHSQTPIRQGHN